LAAGPAAFFLGVDVGTGSARAGVFDETGTLMGAATQAIQLFRPQEDFVEQIRTGIE
jgi:ribulose kinase